MKKLFTFLVIMLYIIVNMQAQTENNVKFSVISNLPVSLKVVSPNGKYLAGGIAGTNFILNTESDELMILRRESSVNMNIINAVSDIGIFVGGIGEEGGSLPAYYKNGEWILLPGNNVKGSLAFAINSDASIIGGYQFPDEGTANVFKPCIWLLNEDSEYDIYMLPMPATDFFGELPRGCRVENMSDDGSIIMGKYSGSVGIQDTYPIIWKKNESGDYEYTEIAKDIVYQGNNINQYQSIEGHNMYMSGNGRYITTTLNYIDIETYNFCQNTFLIDLESSNDPYFTFKDPLYGIYNIPTNTIEGPPVWGRKTLSNGITFASTPNLNTNLPSSGLVYMPNTNTSIKYEDWIKTEYGVDIFINAEGDSTGLTMSGVPIMTSDGNLIGGIYTSLTDGHIYTYYIKKDNSTNGIERGISDENLNAYIQNDMLTVTGEISNLYIYNLQGKLISEYKRTSFVDVRGLNKGVYLVRLISVNGLSKTIKVIK